VIRINHTRKAIGKNGKIAAIIAIVVAMGGVLGVGIPASQPHGASSTETTATVTSSATAAMSDTSVTVNESSPATSSSVLDPLTGLRLTLNVSANPNWMGSVTVVSVTVYEFNTLNKVNNVSAESRCPQMLFSSG
jgi:hypothetical protein